MLTYVRVEFVEAAGEEAPQDDCCHLSGLLVQRFRLKGQQEVRDLVTDGHIIVGILERRRWTRGRDDKRTRLGLSAKVATHQFGCIWREIRAGTGDNEGRARVVCLYW